ncbi:invs-b [Symbiodinium sp. CCMP2592]|nr:invs-b [Symbiodinium sp. CCMP2592]
MRLPPPLALPGSLPDKALLRAPAEDRAIYDEGDESFIKSHRELPAMNPLELQGLLFTVAFGDEPDALMLISSAGDDPPGSKPLEKEKKAELDAKDQHGRTALHCAASRGSEAIAKMFEQLDPTLQTGACDVLHADPAKDEMSQDHSNFVYYIDAPDRYLRSALHMAARAGHAQVCRLLLDHRLFTAANAVDCDGQTALHHAAAAGHDDVCKLLMDHESFTAVDAVDVFGRTALHHAARGGHAPVASVLLTEAEVSTVWATDCDHLTALHSAAFRGHLECCETLLQHASLEQVCKAGILEIASLRHAREDVRAVIQAALEKVGVAFEDPKEVGVQVAAGATDDLGFDLAIEEVEEEEEGSEEQLQLTLPSPTDLGAIAEGGSPGTRSPRTPEGQDVPADVLTAAPLLAIHQKLLEAKMSLDIQVVC